MQSRLQSAILALWNILIGILNDIILYRLYIFHMQISVFQFVIPIQKQIFKELFKVFCRGTDPFREIIVICSHQSIPEIPRVIGKDIISDTKAKGF